MRQLDDHFDRDNLQLAMMLLKNLGSGLHTISLLSQWKVAGYNQSLHETLSGNDHNSERRPHDSNPLSWTLVQYGCRLSETGKQAMDSE
jgi:hypothetical protein